MQRLEEGMASPWIPLCNRWDSKLGSESLLQSEWGALIAPLPKAPVRVNDL